MIGVGKMGSCILHAVVENKIFEKKDILLYVRNQAQKKDLENQGFQMASSEAEVFMNVKQTVLAVKPQSFEDILRTIASMSYQQVVISIAAGITFRFIQNFLPNAKVIRVMPNTPMMIGKGATAIAAAANVSQEELDSVVKIFSSTGAVSILTEDLMDAVIPVSGSIPAFIYYFAQAIIAQAVEDGIDEATARRLCAQGISGSAEMILKSPESIEQLISNVCSPKGTTLAGLEVLKNHQFQEIIKACSKATTQRSKELSK